MIRPYISVSSMGSWSSCQLKWYFSYILNMRDEPNKKALMGNIVHSVAEVLGLIKIEIQNGKQEGVVNTEEIKDVLWDEVSFLYPSILNKEEVDLINKSRINKQTYISDCNLSIGTIRLGRDFVNSLITKSWDYYTRKYNTIDWTKSDNRDVINWTWMLLEELDIRKLNIIGCEVPFDLPIEHPDCLLDDGSYIRVKGFIDLIHQPSSEVLEILDFKTGRRQDFNSGEEKTLASLSKDLQLCLYKYIAKKLYPEYQYFIPSIQFIRDGGLLTPDIDDNSDEIITKTIHEHIQELKNATELSVLSEDRTDFRCKYLCSHSKLNTFDSNKCNCEVIKNSVRSVGIEETTKKFKV